MIESSVRVLGSVCALGRVRKCAITGGRRAEARAGPKLVRLGVPLPPHHASGNPGGVALGGSGTHIATVLQVFQRPLVWAELETQPPQQQLAQEGRNTILVLVTYHYLMRLHA